MPKAVTNSFRNEAPTSKLASTLTSSSLEELPILGAVTSARWRILYKVKDQCIHSYMHVSKRTFLLEVVPEGQGAREEREYHQRVQLQTSLKLLTTVTKICLV